MRDLRYKPLQLAIPEITERLCNFLNQHPATVTINSATSREFPLRSGVPQGRGLSPTLFITYTTHITSALGNKNINIYYVDDATQTVISNCTLSEHTNLVQREKSTLNSCATDRKVNKHVHSCSIRKSETFATY